MPLARANDLLLGRACEILAENAAEATKGRPKRELNISLRCTTDRVELVFCDTGHGIASEYRTDFGKRPLPREPSLGIRDAHGLGIGAALVGFMCEGYGGALRVDDYGPGSTTIIIALPQAL